MKREDWNRRYAEAGCSGRGTEPLPRLRGERARSPGGPAGPRAARAGTPPGSPSAAGRRRSGLLRRGSGEGRGARGRARCRRRSRRRRSPRLRAGARCVRPRSSSTSSCRLPSAGSCSSEPLAQSRPGGTFLLVGHDLTNVEHGHGGPSDPAVLLTPDEVAAELPGLDVVKAERVLRPVEGADRPAIDALVRAQTCVTASTSSRMIDGRA